MKIRLSGLFAIAFIVALSACKKNNDAPTVVQQVGLNVVNASPDTFNFYLNGSRLNSTSTILPGYSTGYYTVPAGQQSYQIKKPFNTLNNTIQTLFSITIPADIYPYHSLFVTDESAGDAFVTVDTLKNVTAVADTSYIRLVNSSPGSGGLDMSFGNTMLFSNIPFKKASNFILLNTVSAASITGATALKIFNTGLTVPLVIDSVNFSAGSSYTIYTLGKPGSTGFTIGIRQN